MVQKKSDINHLCTIFAQSQINLYGILRVNATSVERFHDYGKRFVRFFEDIGEIEELIGNLFQHIHTISMIQRYVSGVECAVMI